MGYYIKVDRSWLDPGSYVEFETVYQMYDSYREGRNKNRLLAVFYPNDQLRYLMFAIDPCSGQPPHIELEKGVTEGSACPPDRRGITEFYDGEAYADVTNGHEEADFNYCNKIGFGHWVEQNIRKLYEEVEAP